jgi:hypothetical protein
LKCSKSISKLARIISECSRIISKWSRLISKWSWNIYQLLIVLGMNIHNCFPEAEMFPEAEG